MVVLDEKISNCGDLPGNTTMESKGSYDVKLYNSSLVSCHFLGDIKGVIATSLTQEGRDAMRSLDGGTGTSLPAAALKTKCCNLGSFDV